jgi:hypothetical protein
MSPRRPLVIVVAPTQREAAQIARELGYKPHSREVKLISRGNQVRGLSLTADDHVVRSARWQGWRLDQAEDITENLRIAACTSPVPPSVDWWELP